MDDEIYAMLHGRILAQEMLMRAVLTGMLANSADPLAGLEQMRNDFRSTLQNAERPIGEQEDAICEQMVKAHSHELDQVEIRLKEHLGKSLGRGS